MQFPWLEELVKKGHVTSDERNSIYADCGAIVKMGADTMNPLAVPAGMAVTFGINALLSRMLGGASEASEVKTTLDAIARNRKKILAQPEFAQHQEKAEARFDEIAKLAPTVARNQTLVGRLLKDKLHSGLTSEDVNSLAIIQASYTPRYGFQEKLTKKAEDLGALAADMVLICHEAGLTKTAAGLTGGLGKVLSHSLMMTAGPVLFGLGRGAVDHLSAMRDKKVREQKLTESFQAALNHPDADILRDQPEKARQAFQALTHFSPSVAMQPTAARSFMKKLIDYKGDIHSGDIKDLASIEKDMKGSGPSPFLKGFREGAESAGFKDSFRGALKPFTEPYSTHLENELNTQLGNVKSNARPAP